MQNSEVAAEIMLRHNEIPCRSSRQSSIDATVSESPEMEVANLLDKNSVRTLSERSIAKKERAKEMGSRVMVIVELLLHTTSFLDASDLIVLKGVSKRWNQICCTTLEQQFICKKEFQSCKELRKAVDDYCGSNIKKCRGPFDEVCKVYGFPINRWKVGQVTDFSFVFSHKHYFNEYIGDWDTSKATSFMGTFVRAYSFNQDLSKWNVSNATTMTSMFERALSFNQPLDSWDVSQVYKMDTMFAGARSFNQPLDSWNMRNVWDIRKMFQGAKAFNQPILSWNVDYVCKNWYAGIFDGATAFQQRLPERWTVEDEGVGDQSAVSQFLVDQMFVMRGN